MGGVASDAAHDTDGAFMGFITTIIIAINLAVFAMWTFADASSEMPQFLVDNFLVSWTAITEGRPWTLVTSVFSHNLLWHLFLNMYALSSFGAVMERSLGVFRYLRFYFVAGIIGSFCHAAVSAFIIGNPDLPAHGASGAIAGIILLFSLLFPREKLLILGIIPIPAIFGALLFVGLDIWGLVAQAEGGGLPIGHGAHLGGALTGLIYYLLYFRRRVRTLA